MFPSGKPAGCWGSFPPGGRTAFLFPTGWVAAIKPVACDGLGSGDQVMRQEISKRRTFAIISHPDAGKTTLTEKFLLYSGALQLAGSVTARKNQRETASDWMELEKQRGISISSTVMQFEYEGKTINLLDTPGHQDFSEDTYRVLTAVDAAVMVIDAAKGIEAQTLKLFDVCRMRGVPIFTFVNKCDRPGRPPLELIDEVERGLGIEVFPVNWPLGTGIDFRGVVDRRENRVHLFQRTTGGLSQAPVEITDLSEAAANARLQPGTAADVSEELSMLDAAGSEFDREAVLAGKQTPIYFGSALNNFGVQLLLDGFLQHAPEPVPRRSGERVIAPEEKTFSGFVFKIQANMDPNHRDRVIFVRVCSGKFERDMSVTHVQSGRKLRLSFSHKLFGRDRETSDEAWPGDIVAIAGHGDVGIGDTLTQDPSIVYGEIPRFPPETFVYIQNTDTSNYKRFRAGVDQLLQEKVVQRFYPAGATRADPLIGAVGPLQFDVVRHRLEAEYRAKVRMDPAPWTVVRWLEPGFDPVRLEGVFLGNGIEVGRDDRDRPVLLVADEWTLRYFREKNPEVPLLEREPAAVPVA